MNRLERRGVLQRRPGIQVPLSMLISGFFLSFVTPLGCALFKQTGTIRVSKLERHVQAEAAALEPPPEVLYYNKGL